MNLALLFRRRIEFNSIQLIQLNSTEFNPPNLLGRDRCHEIPRADAAPSSRFIDSGASKIGEYEGIVVVGRGEFGFPPAVIASPCSADRDGW